tara:strand:+ start:1575 stop:1712 length:138 start_codon:yes stop_codon:yes gene_type:complete
MFLKEFEICFNDLDLNRYLVNISYLKYRVEIRLAFIQKIYLNNIL